MIRSCVSRRKKRFSRSTGLASMKGPNREKQEVKLGTYLRSNSKGSFTFPAETFECCPVGNREPLKVLGNNTP